MGKGEVKLYLLPYDMIQHLRGAKNSAMFSRNNQPFRQSSRVQNLLTKFCSLAIWQHHVEKEIMNILPFIMASKARTNLGINLITEPIGNFKSLEKEIEA